MKAKAAFSLLELIIVLAIVALMATISLPAFSCLRRAQVRCEVEKLATHIQYLQGVAVATGCTQEYLLPAELKTTFARRTISCSPSGVVCAGTVYLADKTQQFAYSLSVPVGGYYRYINEQNPHLTF
jgi:prepilin-type N-terminal cleavage/methylation domain-containing protein